MHMTGQKNVNSVKTTLYYGPKKSTGCPFFPISHEKITGSCHFFQVFYEKPPAVKPIYGQKNFKSVKITLFWARKDNRMP